MRIDSMGQLPPGMFIGPNGHIYARCEACGKLVKLTGFFGSLNLCKKATP